MRLNFANSVEAQILYQYTCGGAADSSPCREISIPVIRAGEVEAKKGRGGKKEQPKPKAYAIRLKVWPTRSLTA